MLYAYCLDIVYLDLYTLFVGFFVGSFDELVDKKNTIEMIYLMLDDNGVEIFVFLLLLFAFDIQKLYLDTFVSLDHTGTVGEWNTRFFSYYSFFGFVYDDRIDHDGLSQ